jgi:hypothetical protein
MNDAPKRPLPVAFTRALRAGQTQLRQQQKTRPEPVQALSHWAADQDTLQTSRAASSSLSHSQQPVQSKSLEKHRPLKESETSPHLVKLSCQAPIDHLSPKREPVSQHPVGEPSSCLLRGNLTKPDTADSSDAASSPLPLLADTAEAAPPPSNRKHVCMTLASEQGGALHNLPGLPSSPPRVDKHDRSQICHLTSVERVAAARATPPKGNSPHCNSTTSCLLIVSRPPAETKGRVPMNNPKACCRYTANSEELIVQDNTARADGSPVDGLRWQSQNRPPTIEPAGRPLTVSTPRGRQHLWPPTPSSSLPRCNHHAET